MPPARKKGRAQANPIARALFGVPWGRMEPRERREEVALVLRRSDSEKLRFLAERALDPTHDRTSFATLCSQFDLSYKQIAQAYKEIKHSEGLLRVADHIPALMEQVAVDAKSKTDRCFTCAGSGTVSDGKPCKDCQGKGTRYTPGEVERLKLVFDMIEPRHKPGISVNIDQRGQQASTDDLRGSISGIIEGNTQAEEPADGVD
jgi:hypothetical protein